MSDQVIKLFEALSDVDEELLERCSRKVNQKNVTVHRLFWRYGKAMAAGICLMVVGAASWGGYNLITGSCGADSSGAAQSMETTPAGWPGMVQSTSVADGGAADCNGRASLEGYVTGSGSGFAAEMEEGSTESKEAANLAASPEAAQQETVQNIQSQNSASADQAVDSEYSYSLNASEKEDQSDGMEKLREQENALSDSRQVIPWEQACALEPFGSYLPAVLPAGYEPFSARRSVMSDLKDNVIFKWCDGEHIFYLNMTPGEVMTREDLERQDGLYEYLAEDFRKELIPELLPIGEPISFTLYYADGMKIEFNGYISVDEMWEVVESVSK